MTQLKITKTDWETLKIKLSRKYNSLTDSDLYYEEGHEVALVEKLAKRLHRTTEYVIFTLSKELSDLSSNRV
ncbi:hypothetical protein [Sphingobacterium rhinopitheci]|uniref:hypothetical protein n=1 Tax=Sphingobacterium rhinopitheci TaxID=2781960 RepID=UPI001F5167FF|nr:hypothetical protein [Sphingobacterium rhinopitheci]MCI0921102.1 hypothetical protein [Sphingobacterium rhinopitheci]